MGQAMTRLFRRLLGRGCEETAGTCSAFDLYWKLAKAILQFLRQLLGGRARKPPPQTGLLDKYIDREKEQQEIVESASVSADQIGSVVNEAETSGGGQVVENLSAPEQPKLRPYSADQRIESSGSGQAVSNLSAPPEEPKLVPYSADQRIEPGGGLVEPKTLGPYSADQRMLVVGEGDFSFASSLAVAFGDASNLIATSLDSLAFLKENYKKAETNILALTSRGCKVMHGVDATTMAIDHPQLRSLRFNCILFNFPRAVFADPKPARDAQLSKHQAVIREFLANAKQMIRHDGQIHITHQCFGYYLQWDIETLGSSEGLRLVAESPFNSKEYPGYCAKYGCGGDGSFNCNPSVTYKFQLPSKTKKKKTRRKPKKLEDVC